MPKWVSPLFSDIRNALGESVVFSNWKGRGYFRQYVVPANPRTNPQQANRDVMRKLVARWKEIIDTNEKKQAWNSIAADQLITGYNLFVKEGRKSEISAEVTSPWDGSSAEITITYTLGLGAADAKIYQLHDGTLTDVTPEEGLSSEPNSTFTVEVTEQGDYEFYIADGRVLVEGDTAPKDYQAITKWKANESTGQADEAKVTV